MDNIAELIFKNQRAQAEKLLKAGFQKRGQQFVQQQPLLAAAFTLTVTVTLPNTVITELIDNETQQPYTLHLIASNTGNFVAQVRQAYTEALQTIAMHCFETDVFQTDQAHLLIQTIRKNYGDELEFLWKKFPDNAIWRRADTKKWYALLMKISKRKLGLDSDEIVTITDFRLTNKQRDRLIDNQTYFPGYHMNKQHWFTIILDGSVSDQDLLQYLQTSYELAH